MRQLADNRRFIDAEMTAGRSFGKLKLVSMLAADPQPGRCTGGAQALWQMLLSRNFSRQLPGYGPTGIAD